ncbi:Uncharacterised protein [Mycobacteroides abscessus subsp. abscessus]|nr:Uncharacterised protein [Mycobacteroides abscessus subsp. abscessus]
MPCRVVCTRPYCMATRCSAMVRKNCLVIALPSRSVCMAPTIRELRVLK